MEDCGVAFGSAVYRYQVEETTCQQESMYYYYPEWQASKS